MKPVLVLPTFVFFLSTIQAETESQENILLLHEAGLNSSTMVKKIQIDRIDFGPTAEILVGLKNLGLADEVMDVVLNAETSRIETKEVLGALSSAHKEVVSWQETSRPQPGDQSGGEHLRVTGNMQVSKLIYSVGPKYPDLARKARVAGRVVLQTSVDEQGNVIQLKVLRGHPLLTSAAMEAVRQWKYQPALVDGKPVPAITISSVQFDLWSHSDRYVPNETTDGAIDYVVEVDNRTNFTLTCNTTITANTSWGADESSMASLPRIGILSRSTVFPGRKRQVARFGPVTGNGSYTISCEKMR